jgi:hypothetical protein
MMWTLIELGNASSLLRFLRNLIRIGISGMGGRSVLANHLAGRNFSSQIAPWFSGRLSVHHNRIDGQQLLPARLSLEGQGRFS